jgi:hypothetical protein
MSLRKCLNDQVNFLHQNGVFVTAQRIEYEDFSACRLHPGDKNIAALFRFMTVPSAIYKQDFFTFQRFDALILILTLILILNRRAGK